MDSTCNKEICLMSIYGETLQVSQNLLENSSSYIHQVISNSKSKVLLFPDVQFEDLTDLMDHVQFGTALEENSHRIALKYGLKPVTTGETHLPLKKRPLELTPPSSPEDHNLVIDEDLSPSNFSFPASKSVSPIPEISLPTCLPWPLLLQQIAMQKVSQSSSMPSYSSELLLGNSSRVDQTESSQSKDCQELINCDECGKMFRGSGLRIHKRRVHRLLQEPITCCGQDFPTRWHLSQHRKSGDHLPTLWNEGCMKDAKSLLTTK